MPKKESSDESKPPRKNSRRAPQNSPVDSARVHIQAAKSNPRRKDLELNQAEAYARLIKSLSLRKKIMDEISSAR